MKICSTKKSGIKFYRNICDYLAYSRETSNHDVIQRLQGSKDLLGKNKIILS
jgi:hypothetical protein